MYVCGADDDDEGWDDDDRGSDDDDTGSNNDNSGSNDDDTGSDDDTTWANDVHMPSSDENHYRELYSKYHSDANFAEKGTARHSLQWSKKRTARQQP